MKPKSDENLGQSSNISTLLCNFQPIWSANSFKLVYVITLTYKLVLCYVCIGYTDFQFNMNRFGHNASMNFQFPEHSEWMDEISANL